MLRGYYAYQNELFATYSFVTMFFPSQINGEINFDDIFIEENPDKLRKSDKDEEDKVYYHIFISNNVNFAHT
jgi:hypothetical protein